MRLSRMVSETRLPSVPLAELAQEPGPKPLIAAFCCLANPPSA